MDVAHALERFPPGTEPVELSVVEGCKLRGFFVPAGEGAPVVLHLLGATQSPMSQISGLDTCAWSFADAGLASLVVDYSGVGSSDGERSPRNLERDALAMWHEAVRRAGGDGRRVVIRATSIGTLACAFALRHGARPASLHLIAPVFADTVVAECARDEYGWVAGWLAGALFAPVADIDLAAELERTACPLRVSTPSRGDWMADRQKATLYRITASRSQHSWMSLAQDHMSCVVVDGDPEKFDLRDARSATRVEKLDPSVIAAAWSSLSDAARTRLGELEGGADRFASALCMTRTIPTEHVAAAVVANGGHVGATCELLRTLRAVPKEGLAFDELAALYSVSDPSGELSPHALKAFAGIARLERRGLARCERPWDTLERIRDHSQACSLADRSLILKARAMSDGSPVNLEVEPGWGVDSDSALDSDVRRHAARLALKAIGIPDRVRAWDDGRVELECFVDGAWQPFEAASGPRH